MDSNRQRERILVDIAVTLTTVLDSADARIIDLSENGAQIAGHSMPQGAKFQIEYMGQTVYAQCVWSEIDRMGVRFPFPIVDGPLHDALTMAMVMPGEQDVPSTFGMMPTATRRAATFGRRN